MTVLVAVALGSLVGCGEGGGTGGVGGSGSGGAGTGGGASGGGGGSGGASASGGSAAPTGGTGGTGGSAAGGGSTSIGSGGVAGNSTSTSGGAGGSGTCTPDYACKPKAPNTGDIYADCVARVNQFRACVCLPPLPRWTAGEACADQNASYDAAQNSAHAGFQARICSAGSAQDECPNWRGGAQNVIDGCLQMMFDEGPPPTATCTGTCYTQHGHYINMTGTKYKSGVACGFFTTASGTIWAVQNFQ